MTELFSGTRSVLLYFLLAASTALLLRRLVRIPDEIFRKLLHCILLGSLLVWVLAFETWWMAALTAAIFTVAVYPILFLAERIQGYSQFVTERKSGELKSSLVLVFAMFILVLTVCWGWLGDKYVTLAALYAWGFGDAAAALVGKRFGKHPLTGRHIEGRKSVEGSLAMFLVSFLCVTVILMARGGLTAPVCLVIAGATAAVSTAAELFSLQGRDTITCPLAAMAVLLPLLHFLGGGL